MKKKCEEHGWEVAELGDIKGRISDQLETLDGVIAIFSGMLMSIEGVDLCEKFVRSISSMELMDMLPDAVRILNPLYREDNDCII